MNLLNINSSREYVLAISKVISGRVLTSDSAHSWQLYSAAPLWNQATSTMIRYPTQLHYPDTEPSSPCPWLILIMLSTWLESPSINFKVILLIRTCRRVKRVQVEKNTLRNKFTNPFIGRPSSNEKRGRKQLLHGQLNHFYKLFNIRKLVFLDRTPRGKWIGNCFNLWHFLRHNISIQIDYSAVPE